MIFIFEILLFFGSFTLLSAQDAVNGSDDFARSLYIQRRYNDAITEFYRCAFLTDDTQVKAESYMGVGFCYRELDQLEQALVAFQKAKRFKPGPIQSQEIDMAVGTIMIYKGEYSLSQIQIIPIILAAQSDSIRVEALQLLIISAILEHDWAKVENYCKQFQLNNYNTIIPILEKAKRQGKKSAEKAKWLSSLMPGLGQLYAGDYVNAVKSFLLNGFNFYIMGNFLYNKNYENALIYFLFIGERYYSGGRFRAGLAVKTAQEKRNSRFARELLSHIKDKQPILKPLL